MHIDLTDEWLAERAQLATCELARLCEALDGARRLIEPFRSCADLPHDHRQEVKDLVQEIDRIRDGAAKDNREFGDRYADWAERDTEARRPHATRPRMY